MTLTPTRIGDHLFLEALIAEYAKQKWYVTVTNDPDARKKFKENKTFESLNEMQEQLIAELLERSNGEGIDQATAVALTEEGRKRGYDLRTERIGETALYRVVRGIMEGTMTQQL